MPHREIRDQFDKCKHFTGIGNGKDGKRFDRRLQDIDGKVDGRGTCAAGVHYNAVMKTGARMIALPCFRPLKFPELLRKDGV